MFPPLRLLLFALPLLALPVAGLRAQSGPPRAGAHAAGPAIGRISGHLFDLESREDLPFASIILYKAEDSSQVAGTNSNEKGHFRFDKLATGRYYVRISMVGYPTRLISVAPVTTEQPYVELGKIGLGASSVRLAEVQVISEKKLLEYGLDKKWINADKLLTAGAGSALDLVQQVPSVSVDMDGSVSMRGSSNLTVYIDGRPSSLTGPNRQAVLEQIPASTVERIEIITIPSARYDAEGVAGILNIVLKKTQKPGYNGQVALNAGTRSKYTGTLNFNYRYRRVNFFVNYDYRNQPRFGNSLFNRTVTLQDSTSYLRQTSAGQRESVSHSGKVGADFLLTDHQAVTVALLGRAGLQQNDELFRNQLLGSDLQPAGQLSRAVDERFTDDAFDLNISYRHRFGKARQELSFDAVHTLSTGRQNRHLALHELDEGGLPLAPEPLRQYNHQADKTQQTQLQVDYVHPLNEKTRLEAGFKAAQREINQDFTLQQFTASGEITPLIDNEFLYQERLQATYATLATAVRKLIIQAGVRTENTNTTSQQLSGTSVFQNNYFNLFPSAHLSYPLPLEQQVQVSVSRRINRPSAQQLNPFVDVTDPLNIRTGNPKLNPEYVQVYELSHQKSWQKLTATTTAFQRETRNSMTRFRTLLPNGNTSSTYVNAGSAQTHGLETVLNANLLPWWRLNGSLSAYRTVVDARNLSPELYHANLTWSGRLSSTFSVWRKLEVQVSGNYRARAVTAQGNRLPFYFADLAVKKEVLGSKASVLLRVSDLFNTMRFRYDSFGPGFETYMSHKRESRILWLGFTYRLNQDARDSRPRERRREGGMGEEDMY